MSYDRKFRKIVLAQIESGKKQEEVRKIFGLGKNTITEWKRLQSETGKLENRELKRSGRKIESEKLRADVKANPDEINRKRAERFGCTGEAIRQAMKREKITRKKRV